MFLFVLNFLLFLNFPGLIVCPLDYISSFPILCRKIIFASGFRFLVSSQFLRFFSLRILRLTHSIAA